MEDMDGSEEREREERDGIKTGMKRDGREKGRDTREKERDGLGDGKIQDSTPS